MDFLSDDVTKRALGISISYRYGNIVFVWHRGLKLLLIGESFIFLTMLLKDNMNRVWHRI